MGKTTAEPAPAGVAWRRMRPSRRSRHGTLEALYQHCGELRPAATPLYVLPSGDLFRQRDGCPRPDAIQARTLPQGVSRTLPQYLSRTRLHT